MKVCIRSHAREMRFPLPVGPGVLRLVFRLGRVPITRKTARQMWNSLEDAKKRCGSWELVRVESASGEHIIIEV